MSRQTKRANRRRQARTSRSREKTLPQLPWAEIRTSYSALEPLKDKDLDLIHDASMTILEQHGIEVLSQQVKERFEEIGAKVDKNSGIVRIGRDKILEIIESAPNSFTLTPIKSIL